MLVSLASATTASGAGSLAARRSDAAQGAAAPAALLRGRRAGPSSSAGTSCIARGGPAGPATPPPPAFRSARRRSYGVAAPSSVGGLRGGPVGAGRPSSPPTYGRPVGPSDEQAQQEADDADFVEDLVTGRTVRLVQWYPGHIARAERLLREQLKLVDVVLDVRDARIPLATQHPSVPEWAQHKPRVLVLAREDMIDEGARRAWAEHFGQQGEHAHFVNGKSGEGVKRVARAAAAVGAEINAKRRARGLLPRPARAVVVGFPNVGKSALINRLLNRKVVASAPKPGVTRQLRWVIINPELHLLDSPGVLPARLEDQAAAARLAMCDDIGEAAYTPAMVAAALVARLRALPQGMELMSRVEARYHLPLPADLSPEHVVAAIAEMHHKGEIERAGHLLLHDFRTGALGPIALELPPGVGAASA